jgi:hypothetical protein
MNAGRWLRIFALAAFAVCCGLICVGAQQARKRGDKTKPGGVKQDNTDPGQIKQVTVNVRLPVTVTDKNHRFIVDLKETDFEIAEDKTPQAIVSFLPQSNLPLDLAALMDTSNSVKPKLKFEKDAALTFLDQHGIRGIIWRAGRIGWPQGGQRPQTVGRRDRRARILHRGPGRIGEKPGWNRA